jgi:hypothetical protein
MREQIWHPSTSRFGREAESTRCGNCATSMLPAAVHCTVGVVPTRHFSVGRGREHENCKRFPGRAGRSFACAGAFRRQILWRDRCCQRNCSWRPFGLHVDEIRKVREFVGCARRVPLRSSISQNLLNTYYGRSRALCGCSVMRMCASIAVPQLPCRFQSRAESSPRSDGAPVRRCVTVHRRAGVAWRRRFPAGSRKKGGNNSAPSASHGRALTRSRDSSQCAAYLCADDVARSSHIAQPSVIQKSARVLG